MKQSEAKVLAEDIKSLCAKNNLWITTEHEYKPDLKMIRIKEISIKVDGN